MPCNHNKPRNLHELRELTRRHFFTECGTGCWEDCASHRFLLVDRAHCGETR